MPKATQWGGMDMRLKSRFVWLQNNFKYLIMIYTDFPCSDSPKGNAKVPRWVDTEVNGLRIDTFLSKNTSVCVSLCGHITYTAFSKDFSLKSRRVTKPNLCHSPFSIFEVSYLVHYHPKELAQFQKGLPNFQLQTCILNQQGTGK